MSNIVANDMAACHPITFTATAACAIQEDDDYSETIQDNSKISFDATKLVEFVMDQLKTPPQSDSRSYKRKRRG